jgi:hypothetical protein
MKTQPEDFFAGMSDRPSLIPEDDYLLEPEDAPMQTQTLDESHKRALAKASGMNQIEPDEVPISW